MNGLPYYKAYPRDFIEGTIGMPFEMKCAYRVVLDLIYMQGGDLPDDARYISGLLGCSVRKWNSVRDFLIGAGKIQVNGEFLTNYRAVSELESLAKLQDKQRENRARPNKNKGLRKPKPDHTEPEPEPEENTNVFSPGDFEAFWAICPRKVGKGAARKAYAKAVKAENPATLFSAMQRHAEEVRGKDEQYIPHPATWINQERWNDEPAQTNSGADFAKRAAEQWRARRMDSGQGVGAVIPISRKQLGPGGS